MAKMKKRKIFSLIAILLIIVVILAVWIKVQNKKSQTIINLTAEQKLEDFNFLCRTLDESYPFWTDVSNAGIDKEAIYAAYLQNIQKTKTDISYFKELGYFLKEFKGFGHLSVLDGYMYKLYFDTVAASDAMLSEQEAGKVAPLISALTSDVSTRTYGQLDQSHSGFRSTIGLKEEYQNDIDVEGETIDASIEKEILSPGKVAYIKVPSFQLTNYQRDEAVLSEFFDEVVDYTDLIVDLRGNAGGSDLYWQNLLVKPNAQTGLISKRYFLFNQNETTQSYIEANAPSAALVEDSTDPILRKYADSFSHYTQDVSQFSQAERPFKGKIWVLVDEDVYSASENFVVFCKNTGFGTLVGTTTGGDGGIADPILVSLPNSGLLVRFSMFYGLNTDGTGNEAHGTSPDYLIAEGEDALEACLAQINTKLEF